MVDCYDWALHRLRIATSPTLAPQCLQSPSYGWNRKHSYLPSLVWPSSSHLMLSQSEVFEEDAFSPPSVDSSGIQNTPVVSFVHFSEHVRTSHTFLWFSLLFACSTFRCLSPISLLGPPPPSFSWGSLCCRVLWGALCPCFLTFSTLYSSHCFLHTVTALCSSDGLFGRAPPSLGCRRELRENETHRHTHRLIIYRWPAIHNLDHSGGHSHILPSHSCDHGLKLWPAVLIVDYVGFDCWLHCISTADDVNTRNNA